MELDLLDNKAASTFEGYIVRKDLVRTFARQFPVPTYVVEFMLGRYCASTDPIEIEEGLEIVQRQLSDRTVRAGEEELFKARARESGSVKIIDIITARLDSKTDSYVATLPSLRLNDVRLTPEIPAHDVRRLPPNEQPCFAIGSVALDGADGTSIDTAALVAALAGPTGDDAPQGRCLGAQGVAGIRAFWPSL